MFMLHKKQNEETSWKCASYMRRMKSKTERHIEFLFVYNRAYEKNISRCYKSYLMNYKSN